MSDFCRLTKLLHVQFLEILVCWSKSGKINIFGFISKSSLLCTEWILVRGMEFYISHLLCAPKNRT